MTDQLTQIVKRYYFFDIPANITTMFLLNGLDAGRSYAIKWLMFDTSGNIGGSTFNINVTTPVYDETPPSIITNTLTQRTDTTATFNLTTSELLKRLRIRYRIIGSDIWTEQELVPTALSFNVSLSGLLAGQQYEYQYVLDDSSNNQYLTEWERV